MEIFKNKLHDSDGIIEYFPTNIMIKKNWLESFKCINKSNSLKYAMNPRNKRMMFYMVCINCERMVQHLDAPLSYLRRDYLLSPYCMNCWYYLIGFYPSSPIHTIRAKENIINNINNHVTNLYG